MAHTDGTGLRRLTDTDTTEAFPTWAPDGSVVVFGRVVASGVFNIFSHDPATRGRAAPPRRLAFGDVLGRLSDLAVGREAVARGAGEVTQSCPLSTSRSPLR